MKKVIVFCVFCLLMAFCGCAKTETSMESKKFTEGEWELRSVTINGKTMSKNNGYTLEGKIWFLKETQVIMSAYVNGEMLFDESFEIENTEEEKNTYYFKNDRRTLFGVYTENNVDETMMVSFAIEGMSVVYAKPKK